MAPDKMVGLAQELNDDQLKIFGEKFADYPVFGAVLGRQGRPEPRGRGRRRAPGHYRHRRGEEGRQGGLGRASGAAGHSGHLHRGEAVRLRRGL